MARARVRGLVIEGATSVEPPAPAVPAGGTAGAPRRRTAADRDRDRIVPIDEETWHIHGQAMSKWTEVHIYWVLPLGTLLLFCLIYWSMGFSFRQGWANPREVGLSQQVQPVIVTPVVVVQQAPPPAVYIPPAPMEPVELTPEELDRRHSEYLRSRGQ